jgi:hypothetical protein
MIFLVVTKSPQSISVILVFPQKGDQALLTYKASNSYGIAASDESNVCS